MIIALYFEFETVLKFYIVEASVLITSSGFPNDMLEIEFMYFTVSGQKQLHSIRMCHN